MNKKDCVWYEEGICLIDCEPCDAHPRCTGLDQYHTPVKEKKDETESKGNMR